MRVRLQYLQFIVVVYKECLNCCANLLEELQHFVSKIRLYLLQYNIVEFQWFRVI